MLWLTGGGGGGGGRARDKERGGREKPALVPASEEQKLLYYDCQNHVQTEAHQMKSALSSSDMPHSQKQRLFWYWYKSATMVKVRPTVLIQREIIMGGESHKITIFFNCLHFMFNCLHLSKDNHVQTLSDFLEEFKVSFLFTFFFIGSCIDQIRYLSLPIYDYLAGERQI